MNILGISCYYHDSAACLNRDGRIIAAAQEERFNRQKNSSAFPINAINFCLQQGDITIYDIDYIAFYEKPFLKLSRLLISHLRAYPFSPRSFIATLPLWLEDRLIFPIVLKRELCYEGKTVFMKHHISHAASSFLVSPFEEAAILTADGIGEWATTTYGIGSGIKIRILKEIYFPDSLGLLYTGITAYLGFKANEEEGTVMGLAAYGQPAYLDKLKQIVTMMPDGSFRMDQSYFRFNRASKMYTYKFLKLFGKERNPGEKIEERHCNMAASLQRFTEDAVVAMARHLYHETKLKKLCLAGGIFLNCVANSKIQEETPFKEIFIQPAAGDSGGAIGATCYVYNSILGNSRNYVMRDAYTGPEFSSSYMKRSLAKEGLHFREFTDPDLFKYIATKISEDKVVGWFQGRMEIGPRALGNRSILANPCSQEITAILNTRVKMREEFRPYAPVVLEERAHEFFNLDGTSPFMLLAPHVKLEKKALIPAVTHKDGTARVQTVSQQTNARLWSLIKEFEVITGIPILINTSFNLRGQPMVCTPEDAISSFKRSRMDYLVLGNFVVEKGE
jgi:carbamoyltransferase